MTGTAIDRLRHARRRSIAAAVMGASEIGTALDDLAGYRIVSLSVRVRLAAILVPVGGPFPDIADHVEQAVPVGRACADRRRAAMRFGTIARAIVGAAAPSRIFPFAFTGQRLPGPGGIGQG